MRISDWSSDVCSSDLLQKTESLGLGHGGIHYALRACKRRLEPAYCELPAWGNDREGSRGRIPLSRLGNGPVSRQTAGRRSEAWARGSRSEERRVGKEVRTCRTRGAA